MTRTCTQPACDNPIAHWNKSGLCGLCRASAKETREIRGVYEERESWYSHADDTPPETVLRIATGVRV